MADNVLPDRDTAPKNGYWAPEISEVEPTPDELAEGNRLGDLDREKAL